MPSTSKKEPLDENEIKTIEASRASYGKGTEATVQQIVADLFAEKEKFSWNDISAVKKQARVYTKACAEMNTRPTLAGLCRAMGCSRSSLYQFTQRNPTHPTAEFIELVRDAYSEILEAVGMSTHNPTMSIFLLKCGYGYVDRAELLLKMQPLPTESPFDKILDPEELNARLLQDFPEILDEYERN